MILSPTAASLEAHRCLRCLEPPCEAACPAGVPGKRFIGRIATCDIRGAVRLVRLANPMIATCGAACPAEAFCEEACSRAGIDRSVSIRSLHEYATIEHEELPNVPKQTARRVAVVGAGPAGLSCAVGLARRGVAVTILEATETAGGIPATLVPESRIPSEALARDIAYAKRYPIGFRFGESVDDHRDLLDSFDAVFLATGSGRPAKLSVPGAQLKGVHEAVNVLRCRRLGEDPQLGDDVVVIGGGGTALDAASSARALGAARVTVVYRRSRSEMPAWDSAVDEAVSESISLLFQCAPVEVLGTSCVRGVRFVRTELVHDDMRPRPIPVNGSEFDLPASSVVFATGSEADDAISGLHRVDGFIEVDEKNRTSADRIYAGGDLVRVAGTIVEAVGDGMRAADAIAEDLGVSVMPGPYPRSRDLQTTVCGVRLPNPFVLAASPSTDDPDMIRRGFDAGWGGAVLKTTSAEGTHVSLAYPMMSSVEHTGSRIAALGNIDLISEHHVDVIAERVSILKREYPDRMVAASFMGSCRDDWTTVAATLADAGADLIECSFSCPQGSLGEDPGRMLAQSEEGSETVARWVFRASGDTPVAIKITPAVADVAEIARAVVRGGASAVTASNTIPALTAITPDGIVLPNFEGHSTASGLSGPAVLPLSLRVVADIARAVDVPVLGTGGVSDWRDAVAMMYAGAHLVQVCTAVMHHGFEIVDDMCEGIANLLDRLALSRVDEIVGRALGRLVQHDSLPRLRRTSRIDLDLCIGCGVCAIACRDGGHVAIEFGADRVPRVDLDRCPGCALCAQVCPIDGCITIIAAEDT